MGRLVRNRLLAGFVVVAVLVPSVVLATHSWPDVPDGRYYTEAVAWAQGNGMTTGCEGGTGFCPDRGVTRAENITFAKRYHDLVVLPVLDDIRADIAANPGSQGPAGAAGADGADGADGAPGADGADGADGAPGAAGADGADGADGTDGDAGVDGVDAESPDRVVWVADDSSGDFLLLSTALASITDASASNPYVVRIAPGVYTETATVALKTYVDVEGSGQGVTTITCACGGFAASSATVSAGDIVAEIRHLTIENTGGDAYSFGVDTSDVVDGSVSMLHVTATASGGGSSNYGVNNYLSSPSMLHVTATATGGVTSYGVYNESSSPSMMNVTATGTGGTNNYGVYNRSSSSSSMNNVTATGTGGTGDNYGVYNSGSSSPSVRNSSITGDDDSIYNSVTSSAQVADTMLDGTVTAGDGLTCVGAYDETFAAFDSSCAVIP